MPPRPRPSAAPRRRRMLLGVGVRPAGERRGAGNQHVGAGGDRRARGLDIDAAIDLQRRSAGRFRRSCARRPRIFSSWLRMKLCPPKPGLTLITRIRSISSSTWSTASAGVAGLSETPAFLPSDLMSWMVRWRCGAGFGMDGDDVGAGLGELGHVRVDRRDHQMDVEGQLGVRPQRLHHRRADGDVGHEMPVHHVDMDVVGPGLLDRAHLLPQPREIGREDRRRDTDR